MTADTRLSPPIPILRIFDEALARDFYLRYLGFEVLFEHRFEPALPLYMGIRRDDCVLHLSEHHGDATPGSAIRIDLADIAALNAELTTRGHPRLRPGLEDQPWGFRELSVTDPFGNRIVFGQEI